MSTLPDMYAQCLRMSVYISGNARMPVLQLNVVTLPALSKSAYTSKLFALNIAIILLVAMFKYYYMQYTIS